MITVNDILREKHDTRLIAIRMTETVARATLLMKRENVSSVLVMDDCRSEHGTLIGVFSERDVTRAVLEHGPATPGMVLAEFLERELICCAPSDSIVTALRLMNEHQIRHLPVMEDFALQGVISATDLLRHYLKEAESRGAVDPMLHPTSPELSVLS
ncbi:MULTISPECIES: CBS domain-containing protein [unclassified Xanthobacter]|uniref:CBS domain-containing protein n=1 Tax=unclassified Xanthobacter TaxID=2623496 RepID=UPI001EE14212